MSLFHGRAGPFGSVSRRGRQIVNPAAPQVLASPAVSGAAKVDQALSVDTGAWSNAPSGYLYQWLANGVPIAGANASGFTPASAQLGQAIEVVVTAQNGKGATMTIVSAGTVAAGTGAARLPLHSLLVGLGDSMVAGSVGISVFVVSANAAGGRYAVPPGGNQGVGGSTAADLLARDAATDGGVAKALTLSPAMVHLHVGTNDLGTAARTAAATFADIGTILDRLFAGGVQSVVLDTVLPRSASWSSAKETERASLNNMLRTMNRAKVRVVDLDAIGFDPTVGVHTVDGLHPNRAGAYLVGAAVGAALKESIATAAVLFAAPSDFGNLLTQADLAGTAGSNSGVGTAGAVATGWTAGSQFAVAGANIVTSKETGADGYERQVVTLGGTAPSTANVIGLYRNVAAGIAVGDVLDFWASVEWAGLQGVSAPFVLVANMPAFDNNAGVAGAPPDYAGVLRLQRAVAASAVSNTVISIGVRPVNGAALAGTFKVSRPTWRKVVAGA